MAAVTAYSLVGVAYYDKILDTTVLYPASQTGCNFGISAMLNGGNASVAPTIGALGAQAPVISFQSPAIATCLNKFGQYYPMATDDTVTLHYARRLLGGALDTANPVSLTINEGALFMRRLSARHNQPAEISYDLVVLYDTTNLPIVYGTEALPTDAILAEKYTLGPLQLNAALVQVQSIDWDTGYDLFVDGSNGVPYPTLAAIAKQEPTVTVETYDMTFINTVSTIGKTLAHSGFFLRKYSETLGRVTDITATNISVLFNSTWCHAASVDGAWRDTAKPGLILRPIYDGTNAVAIIDTTAAVAVFTD